MQRCGRPYPGRALETDALLTLNEARAALIGENANRKDAWPSIKTLRRAYEAEQLAVIQPVPGGRVMVRRSEIMRWAGTPRAARRSTRSSVPQPKTPPATPKQRRQSQRKATGRVEAAGPGVPAVSRECAGMPPRLSMADLRAA